MLECISVLLPSLTPLSNWGVSETSLKLCSITERRWWKRDTDPELRGYYESISQICTNQGLVEYLSSVCPCLDDVKARHAKICDTCLDEHKKILRCSRCHKAKYCTPTCQKRDWKYHKRYCNKFVNAQQQLEKMKEES